MTGKPSHAETSLDVLDPRFPIRLGGSPIFDALIADWPDRDTVISLARRAGFGDAVEQERFVAARAGETQPLRAIEPLRVVEPEAWELPHGDAHWYRQAQDQLDETELEHEWDTMPRTAVLEDDHGRLHDRRTGRFIKGGAS